VALLLATMKTPWRFRTKRNLWAYAGLAVVTETSADHEFLAGRAVRRAAQAADARAEPQPQPLPEGRLQECGHGRAPADPAPFRTSIDGMLARGMREEMARLTLARKFAAITLRLWKTGELYDPTKLTTQVT
jgi:hypothetical protein